MPKEIKVVVLLDGYGDHWSIDLINWCLANGVWLALRLPHNSHKTQVRTDAVYCCY